MKDIYIFQQNWFEIAIKMVHIFWKRNIFQQTWFEIAVKMVHILREKIYYNRPGLKFAIKRWFTSQDQQHGLEQTNFILLLWQCNFAILVFCCVFSFGKRAIKTSWSLWLVLNSLELLRLELSDPSDWRMIPTWYAIVVLTLTLMFILLYMSMLILKWGSVIEIESWPGFLGFVRISFHIRCWLSSNSRCLAWVSCAFADVFAFPKISQSLKCEPSFPL